MRSSLTRRLLLSASQSRRWISALALGGPDAAAAATPVVMHHDPELTPRDELIFLLHTAAEVEHSLMVQYLYALYSLKGQADFAEGDAAHRDDVSEWAEVLRQIAREEMGHLLSVQNVLRLVGGPLNFEREDFPFRSDLYPFHFRLEPLSATSLAKYVFAEMPAGLPDDQEVAPGVTVAQIRNEANSANDANPVNHVGVLYGRIVEILRSLHPAMFRNDNLDLQADRDEWQLNAPKNAALTLKAVSDAATAIALLKEVAEQGEGPTDDLGAPLADSHFRRFLNIYVKLRDPTRWGTGASPTRGVPTNANTEAARILPPPPAAGQPDPNSDERERERQMDRGRIINPVSSTLR